MLLYVLCTLRRKNRGIDLKGKLLFECLKGLIVLMLTIVG